MTGTKAKEESQPLHQSRTNRRITGSDFVGLAVRQPLGTLEPRVVQYAQGDEDGD